MKKYLLLASTALLFSTNAWADTHDIDDLSGTLTVSAKISSPTLLWSLSDVNFGTIILSDTVEADNVIATFTNGTLSYADGKTIAHGTGEAGCVGLSSGTLGIVTGLSFQTPSIDLKKAGSDTVIAQMTNLGISDLTTVPHSRTDPDSPGPGYFINGQLVIKNVEGADGSDLSGSTTVTLQF